MNSQTFIPEEVKKGLHIKFIKNLLELSEELEDSYLDIHLTSDGFCTIVEWVDVNFNFKEEDPKFVLLGSDEYIMKEVHLPDGTSMFLLREEVEETVKQWHQDHPEWVKTSYGTWTNEEENKKFREMLEKEQGTKEENYEENGIPQ